MRARGSLARPALQLILNIDKGTPRPGALPAVYICICNALTERDIERATQEVGADRPAAVFAACRCRAQCGNCVRSVLGYVRQSVSGTLRGEMAVGDDCGGSAVAAVS
jgi:bacterioferritin-associated ferredoxin